MAARDALRRLTSTGVVVALHLEAGSLRALARRAPLAVQVAGVGPIAAQRAARRLIDAGAGRLISWGTAAALQPQLRPGALVLPDAVLYRGQRLPCSTAWLSTLRDALLPVMEVHGGSVLGIDAPLIDPADKRRLGTETGAIAADMESGAIQQVATAAGVECLVIRAIVDSQTDRVPAAALAGLSGPRVALRPLLCALARRPAEGAPLLRLARNAACARRALAAVAQHAGTILASAQRP